MLIVLLSLGLALILRLGWLTLQIWDRLPRRNEDFSLELGPRGWGDGNDSPCAGGRHE
jgi:hypothetical protein